MFWMYRIPDGISNDNSVGISFGSVSQWQGDLRHGSAYWLIASALAPSRTVKPLARSAAASWLIEPP